MKLIIGKRGSGKSTELIKRSAETGRYIMVANKDMANILYQQAKDMGLDIPFPVTAQAIMNGNVARGILAFRNGLLIDDAELVLSTLLAPIPIEAVSITRYDHWDITDLDRKE